MSTKLFLNCIFLSSLAFLLCYFCIQFGYDKKLTPRLNYVTVPFSKGRLGNQLFHIFAGYCIAKQLHRHLYFFYDRRNPKIGSLEKVPASFPGLKNIYTLMKPKYEVKLGKVNATTGYLDPKIFKNVTDEFLHLNIGYGQNVHFFDGCHSEIRQMLTVADKIQEDTIKIMKKKNFSLTPSYICAHVRRTDFVKLKVATDSDTTVALLKYVLKQQKQTRIAIFGDDQEFMNNVAKTVLKDDSALKSFVSSFTEVQDLYLATKICHSFIMTTPVSSFGFWLAYLTANQGNVYHLYKDGYVIAGNKYAFPSTWIPLIVSNNTDVKPA